MGNEKERKELKRWWYQMRREAGKKIIRKIFSLSIAEEKIAEERNDICIYKMLRYPPKSTPPTTN